MVYGAVSYTPSESGQITTTYPMTKISHSYKLFSSTRPTTETQSVVARQRVETLSGGWCWLPAENPSTGCFVNSASCLRRMRVLDAGDPEEPGPGVPGFDILGKSCLDRNGSQKEGSGCTVKVPRRARALNGIWEWGTDNSG